jgi:hypothetical protein
MRAAEEWTQGDELVLLHDWTRRVEFDAGYVLGRCRVCGCEDLLDLVSAQEQ